MVLISAHQCGAGAQQSDANTAVALAAALEIDCEYVEFDVQRTTDGHFVLFHDRHVDVDGEPRQVADVTMPELVAAVPSLMRYDEALELLKGRKRVHLDFKFVSPELAYGADPDATYEVRATARAIDVLGVDNIIVTTLEDRSVASVREWARHTHPGLLVGLSLGRSRRGLPWRRQIVGRLSEFFPARRVKQCDANLVVAHRTLARLGVARWTSRRGLPLVVWTVDDRRGLARWLRDGRAWMVTTNYPQAASGLRDCVSRPA